MGLAKQHICSTSAAARLRGGLPLICVFLLGRYLTAGQLTTGIDVSTELIEWALASWEDRATGARAADVSRVARSRARTARRTASIGRWCCMHPEAQTRVAPRRPCAPSRKRTALTETSTRRRPARRVGGLSRGWRRIDWYRARVEYERTGLTAEASGACCELGTSPGECACLPLMLRVRVWAGENPDRLTRQRPSHPAQFSARPEGAQRPGTARQLTTRGAPVICRE